MRLHVSPRGLVARLILTPGEAPGLNEVLEFLSLSSVNFGIDRKAIGSLGTRSSCRIVVARGTAPTRGAPIRIHCKFDPEAEPKPWRQRTYPMSELPLFVKGRILAEKSEPTAGGLGTTVRGEPIPGRPGIDTALLAGANVQVCREGRALCAAVTGIPELSDGKVVVHPARVVACEEISQGETSLRFDGDVIVAGSVPQGSMLCATGDIVVLGHVGGSVLQSGGCVFVKRGILDSDVRVAEKIVARFTDHSRLQADRDIILLDDTLESNLEATSAISVGGRILGGSACAGAAIAAREIGNKTHSVTRVTVDPVYFRVKRVRELQVRMEGIKTRLAVVRSAKGRVLGRSDNLSCGLALESLMSLERRFMAELRDLLRSLLKERCPEGATAEVVVQEALHSGTVVQIRGARFEPSSLVSRCRLVETLGLILPQRPSSLRVSGVLP